ncbi:MAG: hypothetical protein IT204_03355 [Fimbriimonadaceae bacterium]|nr:hypothetical protein [Fimbriimonadaceae bacterium]
MSRLTWLGLAVVLGDLLLAAWWGQQPRPVGDPVALLLLGNGIGGALLGSPDRPTAVPDEPASDAAVRQRLCDLARLHRLGGTKALEAAARAATGLERSGLELIAAGCGPLEVEPALRRLALARQLAAAAPARFWNRLARAAVQVGVLLSLLQVAAAVQIADGATAVKAIGGAFSASLYGLAVGWLVAVPRQQDALRAAQEAADLDELWIEGLVAVAAGESPLRLADRLASPRPRAA